PDAPRQRPRHWRYWQALPPRGRIGVMLGSWYTQPIVESAFRRLSAQGLERELRYIADLEEMLTRDGVLVVKLWLHLPKKQLEKLLKRDAAGKSRRHLLTPNARKFAKRYDRFVAACDQVFAVTDTPACRWYPIDAQDPRHRELTAGEIVLRSFQQRLGGIGAPEPAPPPDRAPPEVGHRAFSVLDRVDLDASLDRATYERKLTRLQRQLYELGWRAYDEGASLIGAFEGWDAAGKGGAIRRLSAGLDARLNRVISIGAPSDEERAHHYLWRFWRHLPTAGYSIVFDRSWYGRVLVERVEGLASAAEWQRAYQEINSFESLLVDDGVALLKFWLHIDQQEQLERFEARQKTPWKQHKITPEDWRNRERWKDYESAVEDMVALTSTDAAPWTIVPANDKLHARIAVLEHVCEAFQRMLR
ncbi:MAG: polyphosphate:AMP phosphotransferase, partial [Gammaproteobacteria bacterium]